MGIYFASVFVRVFMCGIW